MKKVKTNRIWGTLLVAFTSVLLVGCANTGQTGIEYDYDVEADIHDPFEDMNRTTFAMNEAVDQVLMKPLAKGYRAVVPSPARTGVRNFLRNIRTPVNAGNQLLQGDIEGFARDLTRFVANTSIGLGGLIDVASDVGAYYEREEALPYQISK